VNFCSLSKHFSRKIKFFYICQKKIRNKKNPAAQQHTGFSVHFHTSIYNTAKMPEVPALG
jgi:hypothetical protein